MIATNENKTIATEAGHFYKPDGTPCYEIENKSKPGTMRPVTLRDAKKLNLVPSVTTVTRIIAAPGLSAWKEQQILLAAATSPYDRNTMTAEEWASKVMEDAKAQTEKAMKQGTDIHSAIERYLNGDSIEDKFVPYVVPIIQGMDAAGWLSDRHVEHSFAHPSGYGGKVDYHTSQIIVDFKTKAFDTINKQLAWPEHDYQLAAYRNGLNMHSAKCYNIFISTTIPGLYHVHEWEEKEIEHGLSIFMTALELWKKIKKV